MSDFVEDMVSIIVPVYNAQDYIAQTIQSVLSQTYTNWELLLIDDVSTDQSREKIQTELKHQTKETAQKIHLICKPVNEGAAKARNTGVAQAKGRYIAFLDADDLWMPEKLEKELVFLKEKSAAFVYCSYEFGDEEACGTGKIVKVYETLCYKQALSRTIIFTTTVLMDRNRLPVELMRMPDVKSEDTATWWQILRAGYTAYGLNEVLAIYRRPRASLSSNKFAAVKRIWNLYRIQEQLSLFSSCCYFCMWALRATLRRL